MMKKASEEIFSSLAFLLFILIKNKMLVLVVGEGNDEQQSA